MRLRLREEDENIYRAIESLTDILFAEEKPCLYNPETC
jgi:hypothetical protein